MLGDNTRERRINGQFLTSRDLLDAVSFTNPLILVATYFGRGQIDHLYEFVRVLNKSRFIFSHINGPIDHPEAYLGSF